ncbi:hypothetical protein Sste5346_007959 [Sporothrix stenoceras]|uniref:Uncharacterized protein n=1 Tax=Sporothrix stenoceras TaxID=5173 RepID=A0ABR3YSU6_9PEZI
MEEALKHEPPKADKDKNGEEDGEEKDGVDLSDRLLFFECQVQLGAVVVGEEHGHGASLSDRVRTEALQAARHMEAIEADDGRVVVRRLGSIKEE